MSAFINLLQFATELTPVQSKRFLDLLSAHHEEEQRQLAILRAELSAGSKPFEVVAIAGTAETLLNEIKVGDNVICVVEFALPYQSPYQNTGLDGMIPHGYTTTVDGVYNECISFHKSEHLYKKSDFRKVSTPSINPHQTVSGC